MSLQTVSFRVADTALPANPIEGVVISVYDGSTIITSISSDSNGLATVLLDDGSVPTGRAYLVRFYKYGQAFKQPQAIIVVPPTSGVQNTFDVPVTVLAPPTTPDPRLCMVYGYFRDVSGAPAANVDIHLRPRFNPILLDGFPILTSRRPVRTDAKGYVEFALIRFAEYDVTVQGMEDMNRKISVPDLPNALIGNLLFPVVSAVTFAGLTSVAVDGVIRLVPTVYTSDGVILDGSALEDLRWTIVGTNGLISLDISWDHIDVRGNIAGAAQIMAERLDTTIIRIPNADIVGVPHTITVTA